jgi:hypothetical protein
VFAPGTYETAIFGFCPEDQNHSFLQRLEFGKRSLIRTGSGFFNLRFIENVAGRGKLGGKGNGRIQKEGGHKNGAEDD